MCAAALVALAAIAVPFRPGPHGRVRSVTDLSYTELHRGGASGILVIAPSRAAAAARLPARPVWVAVVPQYPGATFPEIATARELPRREGFRAWIAKSNRDGVCLLLYAPALSHNARHAHSVLASCGQRAQLSEGVVEVLGGYGARGRNVVFGLVPDPVHSVVVGLADGRSITAPVAGNSYALTTGRTLRSVVLRAAGGATIRRIRLGR